MACNVVQFPKEIPYGCVFEIVSDVRSGALVERRYKLLQKVASVVGCVAAYLDNEPTIVGVSSNQIDDVPHTIEGICGRLDEWTLASSTAASPSQSISELFALLEKLLGLVLRF